MQNIISRVDRTHSLAMIYYMCFQKRWQNIISRVDRSHSLAVIYYIGNISVDRSNPLAKFYFTREQDPTADSDILY